MKNKIFLSFAFFILIVNILSFVSAGSFIFKQGDNFTIEIAMGDVDLKPCTLCTCNMSIFYPDGTPMVKNAIGANIDGFCRYVNSTNILGTYGGEMYFTNNVDSGRVTFNFDVTTTGLDNNNTLPLFLALGGFIIFIIAIIARNLYIGFFSGMIFIVLGIYLMVYGLGNISDFYTQTLSYIALGFGLLVFLSAGYEAIADTGIHFWKNKDDEF